MTDPFLLSGSEDAPRPTALAARASNLARQVGVPRKMLDGMPSAALDQLEQSVAHSAANHEIWGDLARSIASQLTARQAPPVRASRHQQAPAQTACGQEP